MSGSPGVDGQPAASTGAVHTRRTGSTAPSPAPAWPADLVEMRLPADGAYLAVLRTATAGLAARLDFTLDDIEDLRIAVDEACALLLDQAAPASELACRFTLATNSLEVHVSVPVRQARLPDRGSFGWAVLTALAGSVDAGTDPIPGRDPDRLWIRLTKVRTGQ